MIAFGTSITKPDTYRDCAQRGIERVTEPGSEVFAMTSVGSIFASYNCLLEQAAAFDDLDALVLLHQDTEIVDAGFCDTVRRVLTDPMVGVIGCVGAIDNRSI